MIKKTSYITMDHPTLVHTTHSVKAYVDSSDYTMTTLTRVTWLAEAHTLPILPKEST